MGERRKCTEAEVESGLRELVDWQVVDGKLRRELGFKDFMQAFSFMTAIALYAESQNHHPEWFNVYNRLVIELSTHDVGGISPFDFDFAKHVDAQYSRAGDG